MYSTTANSQKTDEKQARWFVIQQKSPKAQATEYPCKNKIQELIVSIE
jgi:hypothetical protein